MRRRITVTGRKPPWGRMPWLGLLLWVASCAHNPKARPGDPCETDADCPRGHGCLHHNPEQGPYSECYPLIDGEFVTRVDPGG